MQQTIVCALKKTEGPACPRCACRDGTILPPRYGEVPLVRGVLAWFRSRRRYGRKLCRHCETVFRVELPES
jgi:hypothetical protein